ncbi:MAG TPA: hypothetical protein PKL97_04745 [Candidatus Omnitrophota bacterium]|nr:hypothetical protein [Candidatus Omnitrophota bacterium]
MDEIVTRLKDKKDPGEVKSEIKRKQDEFLDLYSLYRKTGLQWIKEELITKAYELHVLDKNFSVEL